MMDEMIVGAQNGSVQTDAAQAQETTQTLTDMIQAEGAAHAEAAPQDSQDGKGAYKDVSGGLRGRLLEAERKGEKRGYDAGRQAVEEAYAERFRAMEEKLSRLDEYELREDAAKLAKEEGCSEKLAMRILRAERGMQETPKPRDEAGRFARKEPKPEPQEEAPASDLASFLWRQAESIKRRTGVDAMALFANADADVKSRIAAGEMDFEDLVAGAHSAPPVLRAAPPARRVTEITDADYDKIHDYVMKGGVIDLTR